ncbi:hypothetical protein HIN86_15355 [Acinetobacter baumannii]|uniref:hypothetical protein n=1 Tax=Acinetobacter baumannii TaxID=470 RepID=UPI00145A5400|nr:hypothetical protein [Acinetobacter baumannii]QJF31725.1 hypothetical protein HIN87_10635 [Acinetobacter baumannii]QJF36515.1 hypothetical protein HIN86_15355 [Acinetobacter baumannii]
MANSYKDPYWSGLSAKTEKLLKLPTGLLQNIVMHGEKSNADQVSSAGAKTVYQITPTTRDLVLKKYGVDAYSSDNNASMAAGLLLKESLQRNKGNVEAAVGEYHGGTDRKNWGSQNQAYRKRVVTAQNGGDNYAGSRSDLGIANPARDEYKANSEKILAEYDRRKKEASQPKPEQSSEYKKKMLLARFDELNPQKTNQPQGLPDFDANGIITYDQPQAAPQAPEPSFADKALGLGETALSAATGATGGTLGMIGGTIGQAGREILAGNFGTPEAAQRISQNAAEGAADLTYAPRTQTGQEYTQALGEISEPLVALTPALSELALAGQAARGVAPIAQGQAIRTAQAVAPVAERAGQMAVRPVQAVANATRSGVQRMGEMVGLRTPEAEGQAPANVGAAQVDQATIRQALSQDLPYPVQLTEGQMTRDPAQLKFEVETAKDSDLGAPLRQRQEEQHQVMQHNLDAFIDMTGAQATNMREAGLSVDKALQKQLQADKNKVRVAYAKADKSDEANYPVDLTQPVKVGDSDPMSVIDYLNSQPDLPTTPILTSAKRTAESLGIASRGENGELIPNNPTIKQMEKWRQEINANTNQEAPNIRQSTILKDMIDQHVEPVVGNLYKAARNERKRMADHWENRTIIKDLTTNKTGTDDRRVALEDIQKRIIHDGSLDDLRVAKRTLLTSGEEGKQAWRDIQGQTLQEIKNAATAGVAPDGQGNQMISPAALNKAIKKLDDDGKLEFIFGKEGAEKIRALNDISKTLFTVPSSAAINHSNTGSALRATLETMIMGFTTGYPVPVALALKQATKHIKDNKVRARVMKALNPSRPNS